MTDLADYTYRVFIDPTDPITVSQDDPEDLKVEIHQPDSKETFNVIQAVAASLKATVTQSSLIRSVVNAIAANLQVEIHQPSTKETFQVIQATAASLKATVTQLAKDRTVTCDTPANLKAQIFPGANAGPIPVGKIPDGATQIALGANADADTVEIHTVDTEVTLYLTHSHMGVHNAAGVAASALMRVTNPSDEEQYRLHSVRLLDDTGSCHGNTYIPPIEIPTGWKINIFSGAANLDVYGFIHGYEA